MYLFVIMAVVSLGFISCDEDSDEADVKNGKLKGTTWSYSRSNSSSLGDSEYTYTIKFTSGDAGTRTTTGWHQEIDYRTGKAKPGKINDNSTRNFTYIYSAELQQGVITYSGGDQSVFSISDNGRELSFGGTASYELQ